MKNARNPIPIRTKTENNKAEGSKTGKKSTRQSAAAKSGSPTAAKESGQAKGATTRSKSSAGTKAGASVNAHSGVKAHSSEKPRASVTRMQDKAVKSTGEPAKSSGNPAIAERLPENHHPGLHDRSYAAHLDAGPRAPHTKPVGDLRFTAPYPTGRKQP